MNMIFKTFLSIIIILFFQSGCRETSVGDVRNTNSQIADALSALASKESTYEDRKAAIDTLKNYNSAEAYNGILTQIPGKMDSITMQAIQAVYENPRIEAISALEQTLFTGNTPETGHAPEYGKIYAAAGGCRELIRKQYGR